MSFADHELRAIFQVQAKLRLYRRGILTLQEVVDVMVHLLAVHDAGRVTPHCLALLPRDAWPCLQVCLNLLARADYRTGMIFYVGDRLSGQERDELQPRNRAIAAQILEYRRQIGDRAEPPEEYAVPHGDRLWEILRATTAEDGPTCWKTGCDRPATRVSVLCARHQYEQSEGRPTPDN